MERDSYFSFIEDPNIRNKQLWTTQDLNANIAALRKDLDEQVKAQSGLHQRQHEELVGAINALHEKQSVLLTKMDEQDERQRGFQKWQLRIAVSILVVATASLFAALFF